MNEFNKNDSADNVENVGNSSENNDQNSDNSPSEVTTEVDLPLNNAEDRHSTSCQDDSENKITPIESNEATTTDIEEKMGINSPSLPAQSANGEEEDDEEDDDEEEDDGGMSLADHLRELRKRLLYAILWAIIGFIPCYAYGTDLFYYLKLPLINVLPEGSDIIFTGLPDGFFTEMKIGLIAGMFLVSPMIFYQLWSFIAPGLYKNEKAFILPIAFFSGFFFIAGGAFCYFITFPVAFKFFLTYNNEHMKAMLSATEYLSFSLHLLFAFGLVFELPLVIFFLARIGIVTPAWLKKMRRYAILVIVIVAAILAPPDVLSQLLMCVPMLVLYEISIWVAVIFGKKRNAEEEEEEEEDDDDDENSKESSS